MYSSLIVSMCVYVTSYYRGEESKWCVSIHILLWREYVLSSHHIFSQKRGRQWRKETSLPHTVSAKKKSFTPSTSDKITLKKTTNVRLTQAKQSMPCEQQCHTLIRDGMHVLSRKMVQLNGFPNRSLELWGFSHPGWWREGQDDTVQSSLEWIW